MRTPEYCCVDPLDHLLHLCDAWRELQLLPDGHFKRLYSADCLLQLRTKTFGLLLPVAPDDTVTTYDHLKEAGHN